MLAFNPLGIRLPHRVLLGVKQPQVRALAIGVNLKLHISFISASSTQTTMAAVGGVVIDSKSEQCTRSSWRCCFEFLNHGGRADLQGPSGISNAVTIDGHIGDLMLHLGQVASVAVVEDKRGACTLGVTAAIAVFAFSTLTMFDHISGVTLGAAEEF